MEAEEEMKKGNFQKARELFDDLLRKGKSKVHYLLGKADCFVLEGRLMDSLPIYCEAFKSGKVQPNRLLQLVGALTNMIKIELNEYQADDDYDTILQCMNCTGILCDPVTLPCGDSFCKLCLEKREAKKCEHCGGSFPYMPLKVNVILQDILEKSFDKELGANRLRLEGNNLHRKKQSLAAIDKYLEAEKLNKSDHLIQSNLACILISLGRFEEGLLRANKTCQLQPTWPKGYYRKGCALLGLNKKAEAAVAFMHCLARDPEKPTVRKSITKLLHEMITEGISCSSRGQKRARTSSSNSDSTSPDDTNGCVILQRLTSLVDLVEQSKVEHGTESEGEPDLKKLRLDKRCCVEDLECTLCCRLLYEPVTTPCGHAFCRSCLNCNLDHRPTCPICRFSLKKFLAERNQTVTVAISRLTETALPEEFVERKKLHEEEMQKLASVASDTTEDVPIFVCTLAFPSQPCPLHIFEPRYRLMVRQCMESGSQQFGMCLHNEEKGFVDYGVMLEIRDLQYLSDGRSFVDCVGGRRFKVLKRGMQNGYHTAKVEWIKDETIPEEELEDVNTLHQQVYNETKSWFNNLPLLPRRRITNMFSEMPSCDAEPQNLPQGPVWMWWFLSVCPMPLDKQLEFISMSSLKKRLEKLRQTISSMQT
ncbi:LON peptidase N-terminal domain and RING finger protein 3-like isoform X2 [Stylophora pistillata]|uniref:LON peptidase N-terminal domain and RING finger protein 3-like isoform X2 n=1 Tax=Stylophora pistillata TaxID=50429 RepID=UPI000C0508F8|nr:LON peptidase N-terminal domain and RING finger protein 3-like isoform X2 [Stylophora pistillata]